MSSQAAPDQSRTRAGLDPGKGLVSEFVGLWAQGAPAGARDFLARHPEVKAEKSLVLDLAYEEYCCRKEAGDPTDAEEFCARFPTFKASLRRIIQAHRYLEESSPPPGEASDIRWPQPGDTFLGFTLLRELGRGSFARVFLAIELAVGDRLVVVKVALRGAAEADTLGRLRHTHIVEVYSVQEDPPTGLTAVCMPFAGCATLCDVLDLAFAGSGRPTHAAIILDAARDRVPDGIAVPDREPPHRLLRKGTYVDGVVHLGALLADALDCTHAQGVLHRDLKPSNVLLSPDGKPRLLDFNLSFDSRATEERLGGTLPYMAPEHLRAIDPDVGFDPSLVTARSDIFSLGVILYELLSGIPPFGQVPSSCSLPEARAYLLRRQRTRPDPLRSANPQVDPALARLIESCLAFDPQDRPKSAAELAARLRRSLSLWRRGRRWAAWHRRAVVAAAVLVLIFGGAAGYVWSQRDPPHVRPLREGLEAYHQRHYPEAVEHFRRAADAAPRNPWMWFALGRAQQQQAMIRWVQHGEDNEALFQEAVDDFKQAAGLVQDGRIVFCQGVCYGLMSNHPKAIEAYRAAIQAGFAHPEIYNNLGYSHLQRASGEHLEKARAFLDHAIALNPNLAAAYHNRAWVWFRQSPAPPNTGGPPQTTIEAMIADIERAVELSPPSPETSEVYMDAAHFSARAANAYFRAGAAADALAYVAQAVRYARMAIDHGQDPSSVNARLRFFDLPVEKLPAAKKSPQPLQTLRVVDSLPELPAEVLFGF